MRASIIALTIVVAAEFPGRALGKQVVVPKEIDDLVDSSGISAVVSGAETLTAVKVIDHKLAFAGTKVIVFETSWHADRFRPEPDPDCDANCSEPSPATDTTKLVIADVKSRVVYLDVTLRYADEDGKAAVYTYAWKDLDRDKVPELVLTRTKHAKATELEYPQSVVYQVRNGRLESISAAGAICKDRADRSPLAGASDDTIAKATKAATSAFASALGDRAKLACAIENLLAVTSSDLPRPAANAPMFVDEKRGVIYVDRVEDQVIALVLQDDATVTTRSDDFPCLRDRYTTCLGDAKALTRLEGVFVNRTGWEAYPYFEITVKPISYAVLFDFLVGPIEFEELTGSGVDKTAVVANDSVTITDKNDATKQIVWSWDAKSSAWTPSNRP
jgi:hypothetical protein